MKKVILVSVILFCNALLAQYKFESIDINPTGDANPSAFMEFNGKVFFAADNGTVGYEPWITDGTIAGTMLLKDVTPGAASTLEIYPKFIFKNELYFTIYNNTTCALWKTDGTSLGTTLVKQINAGTNSYFFESFIVSDSFVLFGADNDFNGMELWITNGKFSGTYLLKDINPGAPASNVWNFVKYNGQIYFTADDGINGNELWVTNGTTSGTKLLKDIEPGSNASYPSFICILNSKMLFRAMTNAGGYELYISDGTTNGTNIIKDLSPGMSSGYNNFGLVTNDSISYDKYYFSGTDGVNSGIYQTDGTALGTTLVTSTSISSKIIEFNGNMYFFTKRNNFKDVILKFFDGTSTNVNTIDTFLNHVDNITIFKKIGNHLCAAIYDYNYQFRDLYVSDGTKAGSNAIKYLTGNNIVEPTLLIEFENKILFLALDSITSRGKNLFISNGTVSTTKLLAPADATNKNPCGQSNVKIIKNQIILNANYTSIGNELWIITDTSNVNTPIKSITESNNSNVIYPNPSYDFIKILVNKDSKLEMYDVTGKLVISKELERGDNKVNLVDQPQGIYFLHIDGQVEKIIKQ